MINFVSIDDGDVCITFSALDRMKTTDGHTRKCCQRVDSTKQNKSSRKWSGITATHVHFVGVTATRYGLCLLVL